MNETTETSLVEPMPLIIRLTGSIVESNFVEFEEKVEMIIKQADKNLITDDDFLDASEAVKVFKKTEDAIAKTKREAVEQAADISAVFASLDRLTSLLSQTRLKLNKKVTEEKEKRKNAVIANGLKMVGVSLSGRPEVVQSIFLIDRKKIQDAVVGKKKISAMEEAVSLVVSEELDRLSDYTHLVINNQLIIGQASVETPGLFHDFKALLSKPTDEVLSIIESRQAQFKLAMLKKVQEENEDKEREAKRKAQEEKDRAEREKARQELADKEQTPKISAEKQPDHQSAEVRVVDSSDPVQSAPVVEDKTLSTLIIDLEGTYEESKTFAREVADLFYNRKIVSNIALKRK